MIFAGSNRLPLDGRRYKMNSVPTVRLQHSLQRISELMAFLVQKVEADAALALLDINRLCEDILIPVFAEAYGYVELKNLNEGGENYPGVDLGDESAQVAFQVTSKRDSAKVRNTLETFVKYQHYKRYKHLIIYIITKKQGSYAGTGWSAIIDEKFRFSKDHDIRDFTDLLHDVRHLPLDKVLKVQAILEEHFGTVKPLPVRTLVDAQVQRQLDRQKNSGKYIPGICVEVANVKDKARFFAHPALFLQKALDDVHRLSLSEVNRVLTKLSVPTLEFRWDDEPSASVNIVDVYDHIAFLRKFLRRFRNEIYPFTYPWRSRKALGNDIIPHHKAYVYKDMQYVLGAAATAITRDIDELLDSIEAMSSRVLLIVGRAGQGKTNFVCDLVETALLTRDIPCVFFTGHDFNHAGAQQISRYFVQTLFGDRVDSLDEALRFLDELALGSNTPTIVIIDGINEHTSVRQFSHYLERFIERVLEYTNLKVVLTCRSEYFEERFSNLRQASFAESILYIDDLERHMSETHREEMVRGYFRYFKLRPSPITDRAFTALSNDTLLLRMFCEVYGDVNAESEIPLQVTDIYRDKVFREYLRTKIDKAVEAETDTARLSTGRTSKYRRALRTIIELMIARTQWVDIPIADLPDEQHDTIGLLLGEDIILRRDLALEDDVLCEQAEVINFTFDEFRDFLLADHLMNAVFKESPGTFEELVDQMTAPESPVAEGVSKYLFLASRRTSGREILGIMRDKTWYHGVFLDSIFSVEEDLITREDLEEIRERFVESVSNAQKIFRMLMLRWRIEWYPTLNIHLLFDIIDKLDEELFDRLVAASLEQTTYRVDEGERSKAMEDLADDLAEALDDLVLTAHPDFPNLMELLIYLFPVSVRWLHSSPAFETFRKYAGLYPDKAIALLRKHTQSNSMRRRSYVWRMLAHLVHTGQVPGELSSEAAQVLADAKDRHRSGSDLVVQEVAWFLRALERQ